MIKGIEALRLLQGDMELKAGKYYYKTTKGRLVYKKGLEGKWARFDPTISSFMKLKFCIVEEKKQTYYEAVGLAFEGWELRCMDSRRTMSVHNGNLTTTGGAAFVMCAGDLYSEWTKIKRKETTKGTMK